MSHQAAVGPRIFGIVAREVPVVAVLSRGPSDWWHVGRWALDPPVYEPGAWFHGALYPQKCDLSPDGRWLAYSALKEPASWAGGSIYEAISRLPWLTALAAWEAGTTYTRGIHFDEDRGVSEVGAPDVGDASPCLVRYGIKLNRVEQYSVERRCGWTETAQTPAREAGGPWDETRHVVMEKRQTGRADGPALTVEGAYAGFRSSPHGRDPARYCLVWPGTSEVLEGVQWADWDRNGRLLVATIGGALQVRRLNGRTLEVEWSHVLADRVPDPQPPPAWAAQW